MTYIHVTTTRARAIGDFRTVSGKLSPPVGIDGLLVRAVGSGEKGLHVMTVWQSKAHADRFYAEQLLPAFRTLGMTPGTAENTDVTGYDADEIYIRSEQGAPRS